MSRRTASILALGVAAIGSVATTRDVDSRRIDADPVLVTVDPADPLPVLVTFDATWTGGRREPVVEGQWLMVDVGLDEPLPDGVITLAGELPFDGRAEVDATCDDIGCSGSLEISFDAPADTEPFVVDVRAHATVWIESRSGTPDLDGEIRIEPAG